MLKHFSKILPAVFLLLQYAQVFAIQIPVINLNEKNLTNSVCKQSIVLEDPSNTLTINDILADTTLPFRAAVNDVENLNFSSSGIWIRFKLRNALPRDINFILETARPITNKVILYQIARGKVVNEWHSGDNTPIAERPMTHRKCLFPLQIPDNNDREYVLYLLSDGEVVSVPLVFWTPQQFMQYDYYNQLFLGIFYGILFFVAIIYFFFFIALKERSFLYYVIYVFWMAMLQFCLDGLAYQFLFPNNPYLADHFTVLSAIGAVWFVLLFGDAFLKLKIQSPGFHKVYRLLIPVIAFLWFFSFIPGPTYKFIYPVANVFSLISVLLTITTILTLKIKGKEVDWFFTTAFSLLVVSASLFILGNLNVIQNRELTESALKVGSGMEVIFLSLSLARKYRELQAEKENAQQELLIQLEEKNKLQEDINIKLETQVKERTSEILHQKMELEEKNKEILDSINYARRIQLAILPPEEQIKETIPDSFICYMPRDIVSGDFYFVYPVTTSGESTTRLSLFAAVDCTGHGVPGAFMSILGNNILKASLKETDVNSPAQALDYLNRKIIESLQSSQQEIAMRDGMDIALCAIDHGSNTLVYSGANLPAWIITRRNGQKELIELLPDKQPIGNYGDNTPFTNHRFNLEKDDVIYVFTDGYADQFGGPKNKKYKYSQLKNLLLEISDSPMHEQKEALRRAFINWKGMSEQTDDVLVIGVKFN